MAENDPKKRQSVVEKSIERVFNLGPNTYESVRIQSSVKEVIEWTTKENGREVHFQLDPGVSAWRRVGIGLMSLLPIEGQL